MIKQGFNSMPNRPGISSGPVEAMPQQISCISGMINRAQEHNEALSRLIERTRTVADRVFGEQPNTPKESKDSGGPANSLGVLEYQLMVGEQLACVLLSEIQRLEIL